MSILKSLGDFIYAVNSLLLNLVMGIWQMIITIPSAVTMLNYSIGYMPVILSAFAVAIITVSIVFLVVGR